MELLEPDPIWRVDGDAAHVFIYISPELDSCPG